MTSERLFNSFIPQKKLLYPQNKFLATPLVARPIESHNGAWETIRLSRGPITTSFMRRDRDAEGVEKEETWEGVSPQHPTKGLGERRSLPQQGHENGFYAYLRSERSHSEHFFQYFWAMAASPQTSRGPGKLFPLPLSTSLNVTTQRHRVRSVETQTWSYFSPFVDQGSPNYR